MKPTLEIRNNATRIDLCRENCECGATINAIIIGLRDIRAVDALQVSFDFARNGWAIQQQNPLSDACDFYEVAFVPAIYDPYETNQHP